MVKPWFDTIPLIPSASWLNHLRLNFYINSKGQLFRKEKVKPVGCLDKDGYLKVVLTRNKTKKNFRVHHIVYYLFYGKWPINEINHKNHIRDDNSPINLEEVTRTENVSKRRK